MAIVRDIMHSGVLSVCEELPLLDLATFLVHHGISGAPVVDTEGKPLGVVSMSDLVAHAAGLDAPRENFQLDAWMKDEQPQRDLSFSGTALTRDIMTTLVVGVDEETPLTELIDLICEVKLHRILVTRDGQLSGIVSTVDLVRHLQKLLHEPELIQAGSSS